MPAKWEVNLGGNNLKIKLVKNCIYKHNHICENKLQKRTLKNAIQNKALNCCHASWQ